MKQLGDWRIPAIFAVPVILVAGVTYLAFQPLPGSATAAKGGGDTITENVTPRPAFMPTPNPTVAPVVSNFAAPIPCTDPATVTAFHASAKAQGGNLVIKVTDQNGRAVVCAWALPQGGNNAVGGFTTADGTIRVPLASLPADDYFVDLIKMKGTDAVAEVSFRR